MKILYAASEALPFASTGGLADVAGSLPAALVRAGHDVRVVMPLYSSIPTRFREQMTTAAEINVKLSWRNQYCGIKTLVHDGVTFYFLDNEYYFKRASMYGSYDDGERYAFFCRAILEMMPAVSFFPDVLHANDWQCALSVIYLKRNYNHIDEYADIKAIYTIHNIAYQGIYDIRTMGDIFALNAWDRSIVEYDGALNLTKGAIVCCDRLTTVSPHYAEEIKDEPFACGLHYIIRDNAYKLSGILNGIDMEYYNATLDPEIEQNFTAEDLSGKAACKAALQSELGLPVNQEIPLIAMISRLVSHKGLDLVQCVMEDILLDGAQFVMLGTGDLAYEQYFEELAAKYPEQAAVLIKYDKSLSKRIYAGADLFLMPSKSEPCGLAQMIASRYAAIPIVRETGGLYDSIKPLNDLTGEGNGFTFTHYNAHDMLFTVRRAVNIRQDAARWDMLQKRAITMDFSWNASSAQYVKLYESVM
ncbi:MAG: glycogen synthase GlgA [Clostridia bacterium]|nr:glycogen synthase GlgA [Clostridia bacterium]MBQ4574094.1 glycogen synthase GlgA [Clostridia bacterium]